MGGNIAQDFLDVIVDNCDNFAHNETNILIIGQNDQSDEDHKDHHACSDNNRTISNLWESEKVTLPILTSYPLIKSLTEIVLSVGLRQMMLRSLTLL